MKYLSRIGLGIFFGIILGCAHPTVGRNPTTEPSGSADIAPPAVVLGPSFAEGLKYYRDGDVARAQITLENSVFLSTEKVADRSLQLLHYLYLITGQYDEAFKVGTELLSSLPYSPHAYEAVGVAQLWSGQTRLALSSLMRAREFEGHSPRTQFYIALAHERLKHTLDMKKAISRAVTQYEQILRANAKDFSANYELANLLLFFRQDIDRVPLLLSNARAAVDSLSDSDTGVGKQWYTQYYLALSDGILAYQKKDPERALSILRGVLPYVRPYAKADLAELYFYIGNCLDSLGQKPQAAQFLQRSASLDPHGAYQSRLEAQVRALSSVKSR